ATGSAVSEVIGLKENSNKQTGVVYVRTEGFGESGAKLLSYVRWVMVRKRDVNAVIPESQTPETASAVDAAALIAPPADFGKFDCAASGSPYLWDDYAVGEKID